jgi:leucyl aminopeptidase
VVEATIFARDLTNTPSDRKNPAWFARQVAKRAEPVPGLTVTVREPKALATEGFGGILAVGGGSAHGPRLVEVSWRPRGARRHVVLVGKGITFDTGGISIKSRDGMKLMRKDMGGAAAVVATTIAAAALNLPVRVTALAPLAENAVSGTSYRPGDVVRHYGGMTSEILNTDAEGRVVLADALAYAERRLRPDFLIDLATLTGAQGVALGKRTAALYSDNEELAGDLAAAAAAAGELVWRMPLGADYVEALDSDVADLTNATEIGAGSITAALYLREFTGSARDRWAHLDMSSSAWADSTDGELAKGATGWGVRTLLRWLAALTAAPDAADATLAA